MGLQSADWNAVSEVADARVIAWIATLAEEPEDARRVRMSLTSKAQADLLEGSRREADGFIFTRRLLDAVVGASDPFAAALGLREVSRDLPATMPVVERLAVRAGGFASLGLPWAVLPVARKWLRDRVSHLVLSAKTPISGGDAIKGLSSRGSGGSGSGGGGEYAVRTVIAPIGVGVVGDEAARAELRRLISLASEPDIETLAVDVARLVPTSLAGAWALDHDADLGAERLRELLVCAAKHGTGVMLESSDYRSSLLAPLMLIKALSSAAGETGPARQPSAEAQATQAAPAIPAAHFGHDSESDPGLHRSRVGVMLPAELPESLQTAEALLHFSASRVAHGGTPLEIGIGVAGFSSREQIASIISGLAVATFDDHTACAAQVLRVAKMLLEAGRSSRTVVSSEDPHLLAAVTLLAEQTENAASLVLQLRAGTATALESVIAEHGFEVRKRLPLVEPKEFAGAVEYLIALAAETADSDSALAHSRALLSGDGLELDDGAARLRDAIDGAKSDEPDSHRVQHREREWSEDARDTVVFYRAPAEQARPDTGGLTAAVLSLTRAHTGAITLEVTGPPLRVPVVSSTGFANEPDTDASRYDNRQWVRERFARARRSDSGIEAVRAAAADAETPESLVDRAVEACAPWRELRPIDRGTRVSRLALGLASARDRLLEELAAESGAPIGVLDAEVNTAIDAARYLGQLAGGLGAVRGAKFHPDHLALVVADAGVPLGERAEAVLAALAAGSGAIVVAHPGIARSTAVMIEEWEAAGLPAGLVSLAVAAASEDPRATHAELAAELAADTRIERALVLGRNETARSMMRRRPDLRIEAQLRALGVIAVTPSADPVLAARQIAASAFGAAHGSQSTARALVLLGAASRSWRLRRALIDAVASLRVGDTARPHDTDPLSLELGPLPEAPSEAGLRALTELDSGEEWLLKPRQLDDEGLLWQPGIRTGLTKDSRFWSDSAGMPVIGVIIAHSVDDMIAITNRLGGGGVAALLANDPLETLPWLERARAAHLSLGAPTTGGRIERQPSGGWGEAGIGAIALSGGPNRLRSLGSWELREGTASQTLHLRGLAPEVRVLIETSQASIDYQRFDRVRRAALSDALAWRTSLGRVDDVSGLGIERNLLRHLPVSTHVRLAESAQLADLIRVLAAGLLAGAPMSVSTGVVLPPEVTEYLAMQGVSVALERDDAWLERMAVKGPGDDETSASRIRLIGGDRVRTAEWLGGPGRVTVWAEPVTMAGPVELLAFVREQSVTIAAHRHGLALLPSGVGGWIAELQGRA